MGQKASDFLTQERINQIVADGTLAKKSDEEINLAIKKEAQQVRELREQTTHTIQPQQPNPSQYDGDSTLDSLIRGGAEATGRGIAFINYFDDQLGLDLISDETAHKNAMILEKLEQKKEAVSREGLSEERLAELKALDQNIADADGVGENVVAGVNKLVDVVTHPSEWTTQGMVAGVLPADPANLISALTGGVGGKVITKLGGNLSAKIGFGVADGVASGGMTEYAVAKGSNKSDEEAEKAFMMGSTVGAVVPTAMATASAVYSTKPVHISTPDEVKQNIGKATDFKEVSPEGKDALTELTIKKEVEKDIKEIAEVEQRSMDLSNETKVKLQEAHGRGATIGELMAIRDSIPVDESEVAISKLINSGEVPQNDLVGFRLVSVLENTIAAGTKTPDEVYTSLTSKGVKKELAGVVAQSYKEKTTETLEDFITAKIEDQLEIKYEGLKQDIAVKVEQYNNEIIADEANWQSSIPKAELDEFINNSIGEEFITTPHKEMLESLNKIGLVDKLSHERIKEALGKYDFKDTAIAVDDQMLNIDKPRVLTHEYIHSATVNLMKMDKSFNSDIELLMKSAKSKSKNKKAYGFTNSYEFVAEAFSNPLFAKELNDMKLSPALKEKLSLKDEIVSVWDYVVEKFSEVVHGTTGRKFNIDKGSYFGTLNDMMAKKLQEIEDIKAQRIEDGSSLEANLGGKAEEGSFSLAKATEEIKKDENFKKWFDGSEVVDENGEPLVVYHGTKADFEEFAKNVDVKNGTALGDGFYFTDYPKKASSYAGKGKGSNIMPVYLSAKNPFKKFDDLDPTQKDYYLHTEKPRNEILKDLGFDSIIKGNEIVVFEPTQIKSIFNNGEFDPNNPNILYHAIDKTTKEIDFEALDGFAVKMPEDKSILEFVNDFKEPIKTPIGDLKVDADYLLNKSLERDNGARIDFMNMVKPTLQEPAYIIKHKDTFNFIKPFIDNKDRVKKFLSVVSDRDGNVKLVSSYKFKNTDLRNIVKNGEIIEDFVGGATESAPVPPRAELKSSKADNSITDSIAQDLKKSQDEFYSKKEVLDTEVKTWDDKVDKTVDKIYNGLFKGLEIVATVPKKAAEGVGMSDNVTKPKWFEITQLQTDINEVVNGFNVAKTNIYDLATNIKKSLEVLSEEDSKNLLKVMNGDMILEDLKPELHDTYWTYRKVIDDNANELVKLGLLNEDEKIADYVKRYYEEYIQENSYLGSSKAFKKFKKRKDLDYDTRVKLGMVEDAGFVIANTIAEQNILVQKAKILKNLADRFGVDEEIEGYVKISDESVKSGVKKYGALAGKYVPAELKKELGYSKMIKDETDFLRDAFYPLVDHIKVNMTVKNPATHVYNIGSNMLLSFLNGDMKALGKVLYMRARKPKQFKELVKKANEYGLNSYLDDIEKPQLELRAGTKRKVNIVKTIFKELYMAQGTKAGESMRKLYDWEDKIFKLASFNKLINEGMDETTAFKKATEVYVDYSTPLPAALRFVDKAGFMPFLHYQYKATPAVAKVMAKHPIRTLMLGTGIASIGGLRWQNEEHDELKPDWARDKWFGNMFATHEWVRIGNGYYFNAGRLIPGTKLDFDFGGGFWKGGVYLMDDKTPLGYSIYNKSEDDFGYSAFEKYAKRTLTAMENYLPSLTYGRYAQRLAKIGLGAAGVIEPPKNRVSGDDDTPAAVAQRALGVRQFDEAGEANKRLKKIEKNKKKVDKSNLKSRDKKKAKEQYNKNAQRVNKAAKNAGVGLPKKDNSSFNVGFAFKEGKFTF